MCGLYNGNMLSARAVPHYERALDQAPEQHRTVAQE